MIQTAALAGGIAGVAGITAGLATSNVSFTLGDDLLLKGFAAVVLGGFGDLRGTFAGAILLGVAEVLGAEYVSSAFRDVITYGLVLAILIIRPRGLFGEARFGAAR
jgi:branched-chain amino acid transport system permease protein